MAAIKQALVVYSPVSGSADNLDQRIGLIVRRLCEQTKYVANVRPLTAGMTSDELLSDTLGPIDLIIAAGGDGTVRAVLGAVAEKNHRAPVGIVPFGTGNLLAKSLGICAGSKKELLECALDIIFTGKPVAIDLGKMNDKYFAVDAGIGPISNAIVAPNPSAKRTWKLLAYVAPLLKAMTKPSLTCRFEVDGEVFVRRAAGVFVTNGSDMGINKGVDVKQYASGMLDLCIMNPMRAWDYFRIAWRFGSWFIFRRSVGPPPYVIKKIKRVVIETDRVVSTMVDGDRCGSTPAVIEIAPKAVKVIVPQAVIQPAGVSAATASEVA